MADITHWRHVFLLQLVVTFTYGVTLTSKPENAVKGEDFLLTCYANASHLQFKRKNISPGICILESYPNGTCKLAGTPNKDYSCDCNATEGIYTMKFPGNFVTEALHKTEWQCENLLTKDISTKTINVNVPISLVTMSSGSTNNGQVVIANATTKKFTCDTNKGRPWSRIKWYLSSKNLTEEVTFQSNTSIPTECDNKCITSSVLTYTGYISDNGKIIYCTGVNIDGRNPLESNNETIIINYGPRKVNLIPSDVSYTVNETGKVGPINCSADCKPLCTFTWTGPDLYSATDTLYLQNIERNLAGNYTCNANNSVSSVESVAVSVIINYGPHNVTIVPPDQMYTVNEKGSIGPVECYADCKPVCTFTWNGPNLYSGTSSSLDLTNIFRNQTGIYNCTAKNIINSSKPVTVRIDVNYGPEKVNISTSLKVYTVNETGSIGPITCTADCKPKCQIAWRGPNLPSNITDVIYIWNINRNQAGKYHCEASNPVNRSISEVVEFVINYGPNKANISPSALSYNISENGSVIPINCTADCHPKCKITWIGPNLSDGTTSILNLEDINRNQAGDYYCKVENMINNATSDTVHIEVYYGPRQAIISQYQPNFSVNETESFGPVTCTADCNPTCNITWNRLNVTISNTTLRWQIIDRKAAGNYHCTALNNVGSVNSASFNLTVNYPPDISALLRNKSVTENATVFLECIYDSVPAAHVSWRFGNILLDENEKPMENNYTVPYSTYKIPQIQCLDMGDYSCQADNILGKDSDSIQVDVACQPRINKYEYEIIQSYPVSDNDSINITAPIIAYPTPVIYWQLVKNESMVNISDREVTNWSDANRHFSNIFITNISRADFGYYAVYAINSASDTFDPLYSYNVFAAQTPDEPVNITCETGMVLAEISWKSGFNGGAEQFFRISYKQLNAGSFKVYSNDYNDPGQNKYTSVVLAPLIPKTGYVFQLYSWNRFGNSEFVLVQCNTSESASRNEDINSAAIGAGIGTGAGILILITLSAVFFIIRKKSEKSGDKREQMQRSNKNLLIDADDIEDELKDNILYESAGADMQEQKGSTVVQKNVNGQNIQETALYAEVAKKDTTKKGNASGNKDRKKNQKDHEVTNEVYENFSTKSPVEKLNKSKINKDGLVYADLFFKENGKGRNYVIRGLEKKTNYADIDFNLKADPLPSDESDKEDKMTEVGSSVQ